MLRKAKRMHTWLNPKPTLSICPIYLFPHPICLPLPNFLALPCALLQCYQHQHCWQGSQKSNQKKNTISLNSGRLGGMPGPSPEAKGSQLHKPSDVTAIIPTLTNCAGNLWPLGDFHVLVRSWKESSPFKLFFSWNFCWNAFNKFTNMGSSRRQWPHEDLLRFRPVFGNPKIRAPMKDHFDPFWSADMALQHWSIQPLSAAFLPVKHPSCASRYYKWPCWNMGKVTDTVFQFGETRWLKGMDKHAQTSALLGISETLNSLSSLPTVIFLLQHSDGDHLPSSLWRLGLNVNSTSSHNKNAVSPGTISAHARGNTQGRVQLFSIDFIVRHKRFFQPFSIKDWKKCRIFLWKLGNPQAKRGRIHPLGVFLGACLLL